MNQKSYSYTYIMEKAVNKTHEPYWCYPKESKQKQELRQRNEWLQSISKKKKK